MKIKYKEKIYQVNEISYCAHCDLNLAKGHYCNHLCIRLGVTKGFKSINRFDIL